MRAIVTFQERVGEEPIQRNISETDQLFGNNSNEENKGETFTAKLLNDEEFNKMAILRDQELELHFQHLKIEIIEE